VNLSFIIVVLSLDLQFFVTRSGFLELLGERGALVFILRVIRNLALSSSLAFALGLGSSRGSSGTKESYQSV
jgi:hypothetical protein